LKLIEIGIRLRAYTIELHDLVTIVERSLPQEELLLERLLGHLALPHHLDCNFIIFPL